MFMIGLTGGIGSGKSTVARLFEQFGIICIDADLIARKIVEVGQPALTALSNHFGEQVLYSDGSLNREKLRKIIFDNHDERLWVNQLLHPVIRQTMIEKALKATSPYVILMIPLLFENSLETLVSRVLVIDTDEQTQIMRASLRDNTSEQHIQSIISAQISREERNNRAHDIIQNTATTSYLELEQQVSILHQNYLKLSQA